MPMLSRIRFSLAKIMMFVLASAAASALYVRIMEHTTLTGAGRLVHRRPHSLSPWHSFDGTGTRLLEVAHGRPDHAPGHARVPGLLDLDLDRRGEI